MSAAIKMDELLVSWLASDTVYENVLNLIETYRNQKNNPISPPASPKRLSSSKGGDGSHNLPADPHDDDTTTMPTSSESDEGTTDSPRTSAVIPPFYRPPGSLNEDGSHAPTLRARHIQAHPKIYLADQSWEGVFMEGGNGNGNTTATSAATAGDVPPPPPNPPSSATSSLDGTANSSPAGNAATTSPTTGAAGGGATTSSSTVAPYFSIREQVFHIFKEYGKQRNGSPMEDHTPWVGEPKGAEDDVYASTVFLALEDFVNVTKGLCHFPSFFNGPFYKRILYLHHLAKKENRERAQGGGEDEEEAGEDPRPNLELYRALETNAFPIGILRDPEEGGDEGEEEEEELSKEKPRGEASTMFPSFETCISLAMLKEFWKAEMEHYDLSERFFRLLKQPHKNFVGKNEFHPYIKELLKDHPGLEFLSKHAEFQDKYAVTVITRIFYSVNKCHSGRITERQIRRSNLLTAFHQVDEEEDINKVTQYFSYEHFYVLYCRFWELDHDRDYRITREDLQKYNEQCLSHMIVDRIFDSAPRPFGVSALGEGGEEDGEDKEDGNNDGDNDDGDAKTDSGNAGGIDSSNGRNGRDYLTYEDFIFFMLSEEDKANDISVRYWFNCIDVDGDGKLNNMEMRSFYALQHHRMQMLGHENVPFEDMLCQMIDMIKPKSEEYLVEEDFLQEECLPVSGALFDALFNLNKYLQFEQRDPFQERQKREDEFETDWDRFAFMDYNRLAMEEEAREEDAMEIDWVTVDDEDEDSDDFNLGLGGGASEAPF